MPDELKPCPMCGNKAEHFEDYGHWIACSKCPCKLGYGGNDRNGDEHGYFDKEEDAIKAWNSRPHQTVAGDEVENLAAKVADNLPVKVKDIEITRDMGLTFGRVVAYALIKDGYRQQGKLAKESLKSFLEKNYTGRSPFLTEADIKVMVEEICGKFSWPSVPSAFDIGEAIAKANIEFNGKSPNYQWREYIGNAIRKLLTEQKGTT